MKAYVLAAGYATRMYPLTRDRPKTLLEVGGEPILTHVLRSLERLDGLTEIVIVTNSRFFHPIEAWRREQTSDVPLTVLDDGTTSNDDRRGALGDLAFAVDLVPLHGEDAIVLASDNLYGFDLAVAQEAFRRTGSTTLLTRTVEPSGGPSPYNEVTMGEGGRVVGFREKPRDPKTNLSAIALYFFPADILDRLGEYLEAGNPDAPGHLIAWLVPRVPVYGIPLPGPWFDVGGLDSLADARKRFRPL